jgi:tRNA A37 threonylcarbamoyladenosine synthetase subunit TsaC/SUA5/YrdC
LKEILITDDNFIDEVNAVFTTSFPVFIFEFSGVYGLIAPNNNAGVEAINKCKNRLSGKYYSSVLGSSSLFNKANDPKLQIKQSKLIEIFEGSFLRFNIEEKTINNPLVYKGTHQVLIKRAAFRTIFSDLETELSKNQKPSPYFSFPYYSPICSSANLSGDINGSITSKQKALDFGINRNVKLFVHSRLNTNEQGSYPVLSIDDNLQVKIERKGFNDEIILNKAKELFKV